MFGLDLTFTTNEEYKEWRTRWKQTYNRVTRDIKRVKGTILAYQKSVLLRPGQIKNTKPYLLRQLLRNDARMLNELLIEAKERKLKMANMKKSISNQEFPLNIDCKEVDVHYNKISNEYEWMPRWVIKAKGNSYYVDSINCFKTFSTKNKDSGTTKGLLRLKNANLMITEDGHATIT